MASVGRLAAGVAHGINNPLAYVLANLEFALEELARVGAPDAKSKPVLEDVQCALAQAREGSIRIRDLVADLATFSRSGGRPSGPVSLPRVLDSALALAANEIRHRARVVKEYAAVPPVLADESRLAHAFMNLLVNATQAIADGDAERHEIRVVARTDEAGRALVEVRDTGPGLAPESVGSVFEPFVTSRGAVEGDLGLSITYEIVTALGGQIQVESDVVHGTTFRVTLPAAASAPRVSEAPRRRRVLVVDDEPLVLAMCERILAPFYEVESFPSGRAALARIATGTPFDTIVCDLLMPDLAGMDLHAALARSHPEIARRMVFVTGGAFTARAQEFLDAVPNLRLDKPFDRDAILRVLGESLA